MSVINLTPDSFSDGGQLSTPSAALERAQTHLLEGADILDLGAQSTRPGSEIVGTDEELNRLIPALKLIRRCCPKASISIDTFNSKVAEVSLANGADLINDVTGGRFDPNIFKVTAGFNCPIVITHSRGNSKTMDSLTSYKNVTNEVKNSLVAQAEIANKYGISNDKIILDPGLGFAKTNEQNLLILKELESITSLGFPVLVGPSRKRFIGYVLNEDDPLKRSWGTAAVVCRCAQANVSIVRVHDIRSTSQTLQMARTLW